MSSMAGHLSMSGLLCVTIDPNNERNTMSITIVTDITEDTILPRDENGTEWPFILIQGSTAYQAHSRTELVSAIIDGYEDIAHSAEGDTEALLARIDAAIEIASKLQGEATAFAADELGINFEEFPELAELVFTPKEVALTIEGGYDYDLPLYLVTSTYDAVESDVPQGEAIIVIDPSNEATFLSSLVATGLCDLRVVSDSSLIEGEEAAA